jgi:glycosyltransferase involved in cell wall biosynthesis
MGETAGYLTQLVAGFDGIGVRADFLNLAVDPYDYDAARRPRWTFRLARWLARRNADRRSPRLLWVAAYTTVMLGLFIGALVRYDAFVFRGGNSFFRLHDLPMLRLFGKRVVVVFFGTDSRPPYLNGWEVAAGVVGERAVAATATRRRMVARTERHATAVVCHVLSAQLHRRPVVAFLEIGVPRRVASEMPRPAPSHRGTVRVVHAPSSPTSKGSELVRAAVEDVRRRGVDIELVVLSGRPNSEVLDAITESDFVVDEVYSDSPMGGFAAEAAALGRAAVVGGYGWDEIRRVTRPEALPPTLLCHPDGVADAIHQLASDAEYRAGLGAQARRFIEERWSPEAVAARVLELVSGSAPREWTFDPREVVHPYGTGLSDASLRDSIASVLAAGGRTALGVTDKPRLEQRLLERAGARGAPC